MSAENVSAPPKAKRKRAPRSKKYVYDLADKYPDSSGRHVPCVGQAKGYRGVPPDMGWLWTLAQRKGWRPGALGKSVKKWMTLKVQTGSNLQLKKKPGSGSGRGGLGGAGGAGGTGKLKGKGSTASGLDPAECARLLGADGSGSGGGGLSGSGSGVGGSGSGSGGGSASGKGRGDGGDGDGKKETVITLPPPPEFKAALRVNKVKDSIFITINPLKKLMYLADGEDPFVDCDPIVFKLIQPPSAKTIAHRLNKEKRRYEEDVRKALDQALQAICQCAYEDVYCTDLGAIDQVIENSSPAMSLSPNVCCVAEMSDTDDSDWDVEYTPPYAMTGLKPKKPTMVHVETQYNENDTPANRNKLKWKQSRSMSVHQARTKSIAQLEFKL